MKIFNIFIYILGWISFIGLIILGCYWVYINLIVGFILTAPFLMIAIPIAVIVIIAVILSKKKR